MPEPKSGESESEFVSRCVTVVMGEGLTQEQALGKCYGMYRSHKKSQKTIMIRKAMDEIKALISRAEIDEAVVKYEPELAVVSKAVTVGGYESPEPGDLPEGGKKILANVYAKCRKDGGSKEKCAKIAWSAVSNAGYKSESVVMRLNRLEKALKELIEVKKNRTTTVEKARKLSRKMKFQGMDVSIETDEGETREGTDQNGHHWETVMPAPYGYIRRTEGTDGDHVDCFMGPNPDSQDVWVVHIQNPDTKEYDEDKVFLGFDSEDDVMDTFYSSYDRKEFFQSMDRMTLEEFREKLKGQQGIKIKKAWQLKSGKWHDYDDAGNVIEVSPPGGKESKTGKKQSPKEKPFQVGAVRQHSDGEYYRKINDNEWQHVAGTGETKPDVDFNEKNSKPKDDENELFFHGTDIDTKHFTPEGGKSGTGAAGTFETRQADVLYLTESPEIADFFSQLATQNKDLRNRREEIRYKGNVLKIKPKPGFKIKDLPPMNSGQKKAAEAVEQAKKEGYHAIRFADTGLDTVEGYPEIWHANQKLGRTPKTTMVFDRSMVEEIREEKE